MAKIKGASSDDRIVPSGSTPPAGNMKDDVSVPLAADTINRGNDKDTINNTKGIIVSFGNTPQAKDDRFTSLQTGLTEDSLGCVTLDVMGNDLGGAAKRLWSLDDGTSPGGIRPEDLLTQDPVGDANVSANGATIKITADGKVSYDPSTWSTTFKDYLQTLGAGEFATDTFTYAIRLGNGALSWATATVKIAGVNDAPVNTVPADTSTDEDVDKSFSTANGNAFSVADVDGDALTVILTATNGSLTLASTLGVTVSDGDGSDGTLEISGSQAALNTVLGAGLTFTPTADFNGLASIQLATSDGALSDTDIVAITVDPVADIVADTVTTNEDTAISFNPITGTNGAEADNFEGSPQITHINGTAITAGGSAVAVTNGTVTLGASNVLTFTPAADFNGAVPAFSYTVLSGGVSESANIDVTVTPVADIVADTVTTNEDTAISFNPITGTNGAEADNFEGSPQITHINGTAITAGGSAVAVTNGTVTLGASNVLTFTPAADFNGAVPAFSYTVLSGGVSESANIDVTVTPVADIVADTVTTNEDTAISFNPITGTNGAEADNFEGSPQITHINGTAITAGGSAVAVTNGTVTLGASNVLTFTPAADFNGAVPAFSYTVLSGGVSESANIDVTVTPVADIVADTVTTNEDTAISFNPITGTNGAEADNFEGSPQITHINGTAITAGGSAVAVTNGTVTLGASNVLTFTPAADFNGAVPAFSYTVLSGGVSESANIDVTVTPVADIVADTVTTNEDTAISFNPITGTNGAEADNFEGSPQITHINGTAITAGGSAVAVTNGTVTLGASNVLTFTPAADFNGAVPAFSYTVLSGGVSESANIDVTVTPVADIVADTVTTNEDTAISFNPITGTNGAEADNFEGSPQITHINGTAITAGGSAVAVTNGTVTLGASNVLTFTPAADFNGAVPAFSYTVLSGGVSESANIDVTVTPVADIVADTVTTNEDTAISFNPITGTNGAEADNFEGSPQITHINGTAITAGGSAVAVTNGTVTLGASNVLTFTPAADFNGAVPAFSYTVLSGGVSESANIDVTVTPVADIVADTVTTNEDTAISFNPITGTNGAEADNFEGSPQITHINGTAITAGGSAVAVTNGTVTLGASNVLTFTPAADFNGAVPAFSYTVLSGGVSESANIDVTVTPVADIVADTVTTNEDTAISFNPITGTNGAEADNFEGSPQITHINGTAITAGGSAVAVTNGTVTLGASNVLTFTPAADFNGAVPAFSYTVLSGGVSESANIDVTVTPVADIVADTVTTNEDTAISFNPITGTNGAEADNFEGSPQITHINGTAITAGGSAVAVTNGTVTLGASNVLTFTPAADFNGAVPAFSYTVLSGGVSESANIDVTVTPVADAPVNDNPPVAGADSATVAEGGTVTVLTGGATSVLANDTDADLPPNTLTAGLVTGPTNGSLTLHPNGTFSYTHNGSETSSDSFTYTANDGVADGNTVTVAITVTPVNDNPPVAGADSATVAEGGTVTVLTGGATSVLANDTDADLPPNTLTAGLVTGPTNGSLTLHPNGTFSYTHNGSETSSDSFTYTANDGVADGNTVTVAITVTPVNDNPPVAGADSATVAEGGTVTVLTGGATSVLANDTDADLPPNTLTAGLVTGPTNGSLTLHPNGTFSYTHNGSETSSDSFTYTANDGVADGNTVTVAITVTITDNDTATWAISGDPVVIEGGAASYTVSLAGTLQAGETAKIALGLTDIDTNSADYASFAAAVTAAIGSRTDLSFVAGTLTYTSDGSPMADLVISLGATDDPVVEGPEDYQVVLSTPGSSTGAAIGLGTSSVPTTITDNDTNTIAMGPVMVNEAAGTMTFTVTQTGTNAVPIVLNYATADGTAKDGVGESGAGIPDYTASTGTVTFAPGTDGTQTFTVPITNDLVVEGSEAFTVTLTPQIPSQVSGTSTLVATGTITDNDTNTIAIDSVTVNEAAGTMTFTVTQTGTNAVPIVLTYTTADGTAKDGVGESGAGIPDYTASTGTVTFAPGTDGTQTFTVPITNDLVVEGSEAFTVTLTPQIPSQVSGTSTLVATGTITDNDTNTIAMGPVTVNEAAGTMTFTVTQTGTNAVPIVLNYATSDGTAKDGVPETGAGIPDYTASTGTVTFAPGTDGTQTFTVSITNDLVVEGSEAFTVTLTPQIPSQVSGTSTLVATGSITDNDTNTIAMGPVTVNEAAGTMTFTVTQTGTNAVPIVLNYATSDGTAKDGVPETGAGIPDYTASTGTVTFAPGTDGTQTFTVPITEDLVVEGSEAFTVTLTPQIPSQVSGTSTLVATGSITDNDTATWSISGDPVAIEGGAASYTVRLAGTLQAGQTATINLGLTDLDTTSADYASFAAAVTAAIGSRTDLSFTAGTLNFTSTGNPMADLVIDLNAIDDEAAEVSEDFRVGLSNPGSSTGANIALGTSTVTTAILDDNARKLTISNVTHAEGTSADGFTPYVFTVSLSDATTTAIVMVDVFTVDGSATTADEDYTALPLTTLTFAPGETSKTVTVQVRHDDQQESDEYFQVQLSNATNATIVNNPIFGSGVSIGTITNDDVHTLRISEGVTQAEGTSAAGFTPYVFTVSLSGTPTTTPVTVNVSTADFSGTTAGVDYTALTNQLVTFAPGETSKTVTVQVRQDDQVESDEFFQVQLSNATNATIAGNVFGNAGIGTITNDDVHTLRISEGVTQAEGTSADGFTPYVFTVSLSGTPTTTPVTVNVSTADFSGTTAGVDYTALTNQLVTFAPGETSKTVTVQVRQDDQVESDEFFQVQLSNATNATIAGNVFGNAGIGTITDDDPAPAQPVVRLSEGVTQAEGTSVDGFTPYVFTVSLSGTPTTTPVTVNVSTADFSGTTAGVDYTALTNQLVTFAPGETSKTVTVQVRQDDQVESDEFFQVQLSNATNATIAGNVFGNAGIGTITNDDVHTLRISEGVTQAEGTSAAGFTPYVFTVSLSGTPTTTPVTVNVSTADFSGTTAGVDYTALTNQLVTFAPGETSKTVTVQVRQDDQVESDEFFQVQLSNATNATIAGNVFGNAGIGTITNDDVHTLRISEGVTQAEGTSADGFTPYVFTVSLSGTPTTTPVTVNVSTADFSGTTAGVDYTALTNQLVTFAPGETSKTVTVQVRQDDQVESDEFFQVQLSNATNATIAGNVFGNAGIGTITNDDVHTLRISEGVTQAEGTSAAGFTPYVFTVSLSGTPTTTPVTVNVSTADFSGTTAGVDYTALTNQLVTFAPGETSKTVTVQVRQDDVPELTEQFGVSLTQGNNLATITASTGIGTILDDDVRTVTISPAVEALEGTSVAGFTAFDFLVTLSAPTTTSTVEVRASTFDNSGTTAGVDYTALTNQLVTFAPGETSKTVTVQVRQDDVPELTEQFGVSLTQGNNLATITGSTFGVGTITDDDAAPPVVLDLDGDGLEFVAMGALSNHAQFDFNGDGTMETAAWVWPDDGFLVYDANGDRRVNDGSEIAFADMTAEADTDLEALRVVFDSNQDGLLTATDEQFSRFGVWQDANGNGSTEGGEFKTLAEMGIVSHELISDGESYSAANGQVTVHGEASFMYQDGREGLLGDVSLAIGGPADSSAESQVGEAGNDALAFDSGINPFDLVLSRQANDLRSVVYGSTDQVTVQNWYGGASNQVETIQAGNGQTLLSSQVNQLIDAMAGFTANNNGMTWDQGIAAKPEEVAAVIAANWQ